MAMEPPFVLLKSTSWLPSEESRTLLGAVVKNFWAPTENSVPEQPLVYNKGRKFVEKEFSDFVLTNKDGVGKAVEVKLQRLANLTWKGDVDDQFDLRGKNIRYIKLRQLDKFWKDLKEDPDIRKTVPGWLGSSWKLSSKPPVCLITGLFICEDVVLESSTKTTQDRGAEVEAPFGTAITAASASQGLPVPNCGTGNLEVGLASNKSQQRYIKAEDKGSSIFAMQLKVISSQKFKKEAISLQDKSPNIPSHRQMGEDGELPLPDSLALEDIDAESWETWQKEGKLPDGKPTRSGDPVGGVANEGDSGSKSGPDSIAGL